MPVSLSYPSLDLTTLRSLRSSQQGKRGNPIEMGERGRSFPLGIPPPYPLPLVDESGNDESVCVRKRGQIVRGQKREILFISSSQRRSFPLPLPLPFLLNIYRLRISILSFRISQRFFVHCFCKSVWSSSPIFGKFADVETKSILSSYGNWIQ